MQRLILVLSMATVFGCAQRPRSPVEKPLLPAATAASAHHYWPMVGHQVSEWPAAHQRENAIIMAQSAQTWPIWEVTCDDVPFILGVDDGGLIRFVMTRDPKLVTPEGVHVGDTYSSVKQRIGKPGAMEPGWAWYIELPSGWNAMIGPVELDRGSLYVPPDDAHVVSIFQRIGYGPVDPAQLPKLELAR